MRANSLYNSDLANGKIIATLLIMYIYIGQNNISEYSEIESLIIHLIVCLDNLLIIVDSPKCGTHPNQ